MRNKVLILTVLFFSLFFISSVSADLLINKTYNSGTSCQEAGRSLGCFYNTTINETQCIFMCKQVGANINHLLLLNEDLTSITETCEIVYTTYAYTPVNVSHGYIAAESVNHRLYNVVDNITSPQCGFGRISTTLLTDDYFDYYETGELFYFSESLNNIRNTTGHIQNWEAPLQDYDFISIPNRSDNVTTWEMNLVIDDTYGMIFLKTNATDIEILADTHNFNVTSRYFDLVYITLEDDGHEYLYAVHQWDSPANGWYSILKYNVTAVLEAGAIETPPVEPALGVNLLTIPTGIGSMLGLNAEQSGLMFSLFASLIVAVVVAIKTKGDGTIFGVAFGGTFVVCWGMGLVPTYVMILAAATIAGILVLRNRGG